ncbi:unnamed protein product [Didymodactylos carnosus]|uniref:DUF1868 domain-containing protein n=1 Tax=Didymodactylos carnosus TaxID=1234261 RepID=A0A813TM96_9BILA|nr:unnamed protein product [Didymodactylos carnosus]CAF0813743.1 unnamed protein product [Didymodactylos carnosus]CAF3586796.1 unnamed protein product [Didymodactylos carnosus]CAF3599641.1 unnamed protein product [Didymodactylos carnosus]
MKEDITFQPVPLFNRKIDINGNYVPFHGYTIMSHVEHPLPEQLVKLHEYLVRSKFSDYFSFLPKFSYHVTLNPLINVEMKRDEAILKEAQMNIDKLETGTKCMVKQLTRKDKLQLEIELIEPFLNTILKPLQAQWTKLDTILMKYEEKWHLTLAYQYRNITDEAQVILDEIIKNWTQFPFEISLDPITICEHQDMTDYVAIFD